MLRNAQSGGSLICVFPVNLILATAFIRSPEAFCVSTTLGDLSLWSHLANGGPGISDDGAEPIDRGRKIAHAIDH